MKDVRKSAGKGSTWRFVREGGEGEVRRERRREGRAHRRPASERTQTCQRKDNEVKISDIGR